MAPDATTITTTASDLIQREGGFVSFIRNVGVGGVSYAIILQLIEGINSAGSLLLGPPRTLGQGLILLIETTIGGLVKTFGAGTGTTVESFANGTGALLGPLAQPASLGVAMITIAIFIFGINRLGITPLSFVRAAR
ncbi:hypothetical protein [Haloarcula sp. CGMCC 1.2071]|uniref:hypothetical protein n=1 Tax=Haloarcula sp. CGMCC 1.2071 TaxID=3111454 RepID=UPI00300F4BDD